MKYLLTLILVISLSFGALPMSAFAIEPNDQKFEAFVKKIGWEKQDYIDYLTSKEWTLDDFESVDELGTPLTEESILPVLAKYELTRAELNALLVENGDIEKGQDVLDSWYTFSEELDSSVDFYLNDMEGTPINAENLQQLLEDYDFQSKEALEKFLNDNDDSIDNYEFIEDLDLTVDYYKNGADYEDELTNLFTDIGLTDDELEKLFAHFETLNWEDPAFVDNVVSLSDKMMSFEDFETADELSSEQVADLFSILNEMHQLFQIETKFYLVDGKGQKESLSIEALMKMDSTNGKDLVMEIYNNKGELLADLKVTAAMLGSEVIQDTGKDLEKAEKIITTAPVAAIKAKPPVKTVKGGKLPTTATNHAAYTLIGLSLLLAGILMFRRFRVKGI
ncbi:processed acidic surface protein [Fictibacillus barbaricus]|uniref:Processed acidic surface protein n=1 Tax=Fictibacillus barbaricus TaxID=182136 RepID=A0ABU1TYW2_9BACL|nr:processed acidic surface protein [Fictibacillus barbaricus]MDR7072408.1 processed acidic surface protein [Fictibacillus barbaricus]